jgi:glycerophosphoryl diester phosphodiesterase
MQNHPSLKQVSRPLVIAHRGYSAGYPENTLAAFEAAIVAGAAMIELDVTLSSDRQVVVIHDDHLDRTTDGSGAVHDQQLADIKKLDAGDWFAPRFAGERVPTLKEVLRMAKGRILLNIEIKTKAYEHAHPPDAVELQVVRLARRHRMLRSVLISSFSRPILDQMAAMKNPPALALISEETATDETIAFCRRIRSFSWHPDHRILTADQVIKMHRNGIRVYPWTVTTATELKQMRNMGVDGVIVNDPHLVK